MYCNLSKMVYHCFKCEAKGKIVKDKESSSNIEDYNKKYRELDKKAGMPTDWYDRKEVRNLPLHEKWQDSIYGGAAWKYLSDRGLSREEIKENTVRSTERSGPYKDTVIFPIYATYKGSRMDHVLNYFVCRRYTDQQPKYINAPWPKEDTLFIEKRTSQKYRTGVIVEGIFDALAVARVGCMGISILGKSVTSGQLLRLKKLCDNYVIYLDNDAFTHGIKLKLQLDAIGKKTAFIHHDEDASDTYQHSPDGLRNMLHAGIKAITGR